MKTLKLTKVIGGSLVVISVFALNPTGAHAEWKQDKGGSWWYAEGNSWIIGWKLIDGNWYYFYNNGYMAHDITIDGYYLDTNGEWSTNTLDEEGRYKQGTIINLSGTIKKYNWTHPVSGVIDYYVLELDTPANFNVTTSGERYKYDGINEIQMINFKGSYEELDKQVNQHVSVKGIIGGGGGTWYYRRPVTISDWTLDLSSVSGNLNQNTNNLSLTSRQNGNTQIVTFADKNLEQVVRTAISKTTGTLYKSDVEKITELKATEKNIKDISGIENLVNLQNLSLWNNQISDINALKKLTNLQTLWLNVNQISDISALKGLTNLRILWLNNNQISNISALEGLTNLQTLSLSVNQITDISALKELTNLQNLDLNSYEISDMRTLKGLINLKSLYIPQLTDADKQSLKDALPNCRVYSNNDGKD